MKRLPFDKKQTRRLYTALIIVIVVGGLCLISLVAIIASQMSGDATTTTTTALPTTTSSSPSTTTTTTLAPTPTPTASSSFSYRMCACETIPLPPCRTAATQAAAYADALSLIRQQFALYFIVEQRYPCDLASLEDLAAGVHYNVSACADACTTSYAPVLDIELLCNAPVVDSTTEYEAVFSYTNTFGAEIVLPPGENNFVSTGVHTAPLPTTFAEGEWYGAVTIRHPVNTSFTWHVTPPGGYAGDRVVVPSTFIPCPAVP